MKKCPYCAEEIQDEAVVCRYCGRDLTKPVTPQQTPAAGKPAQQVATPPAKKSYSFTKLLLIGGVAVITFCICIGVLANLPNSKTPSTTSRVEQTATVIVSGPTSANEPQPTATSKPSVLGETRENPFPFNTVVDIGGNMKMSVTGVQRPANDIVAQGNMFNETPTPNQEYIIVRLHVECTKSSSEKCLFTTYELKTVGADGQVHDPAFVAGIPEEMEASSEFFGGASKEGNIVFLTPKGDANLLLFYDPLIFGHSIYISLQP